jgi:hypothetical protein
LLVCSHGVQLFFKVNCTKIPRRDSRAGALGGFAKKKKKASHEEAASGHHRERKDQADHPDR